MTDAHLYVKFKECIHVMDNHQSVTIMRVFTFVEMALLSFHSNAMMRILSMVMDAVLTVLFRQGLSA